MRYPENLKIGDTIGICAPSAGIAESEKIEKLEAAEKQLKEMGYNIDKKCILLDSDLDTLGVHEVKIKLHKKVDFKLRVVLKK